MSQYQRIPLLLTPEQGCGYLPDRASRNAVVSPLVPMHGGLYASLLEQGFRRSGDHVYRPHCAQCQQCVPARVDVASFAPNRSQSRCRRRNADLELRIVRRLTDEHYALFRRYLRARHDGEGMDGDDRDGFHQFLECGWGAAEFWEFREHDHLRCVAAVDVLTQSLSAVYTFFDPDAATRGLGVYAVLTQIEQARQRGLPHVYLGYWVAGSRKMDYKRHYQPLELFEGGRWQPMIAGCRAGDEHP